MDINKFPNPKLNLPKEIRDSKEAHVSKSFGAVESYLHLVGAYIYTDIDLDHDRSDPRHINSWIQRIVSANVLRSLYIRNAFVEAFNARNTVGIYLPLKAWFETVGVLASILDLIEGNHSEDELFEKLKPYALGNRGKGNLRVGTTDAVNVATMMEKADKYMKNMLKNDGSSAIKDISSFFTDFYDIASNPSHPSFDAYEVVGMLGDDGIWKAKLPNQIKEEIVESLPGYGALLLAPFCIKDICKKIFMKKSEAFSNLGNPKYFNDGDQEIKKEVGGMRLPNGVTIGPLIYSKDGKTASAILGPAINAFDYGITNSLNRLTNILLSGDEFQAAFNSQVEDLIAEVLIYFQNRLKVITKTNTGEFNSIDKSVKEYSKHSIDLTKICNTEFLLDLDKVRGRKHHSNRRYDNDYSIAGIAYDTVGLLRDLNRRVYKEIHTIDSVLSLTHRDYEIKITQGLNSTSVEFTAENHAFDLTKGAKVVPKKENKTD